MDHLLASTLAQDEGEQSQAKKLSLLDSIFPWLLHHKDGFTSYAFFFKKRKTLTNWRPA